MKGNQGLEALAALCGGQTNAPTEEEKKNGSNTRAGGELVPDDGNGSATRQTSGQPQSPLLNQQSSLQNLSQQQLQQVISSMATLQGGTMNSALATQALLLSGFQQHQLPSFGDMGAAMQQMALQQYIQQQAQAKLSLQQHQAAQLGSVGKLGIPGLPEGSQQALMMALASGKAQQLQQQQHSQAGGSADMSKTNQQQVIPSANSISHPSTQSANHGAPTSPAQTSMKPSALPSNQTPSQSMPGTVSAAATLSNIQNVSSPNSEQIIAPMPGGKIHPNGDDDDTLGGVYEHSDKKQQKRAANRRSAQLSRKRKKQFIEELKEENDELRRKEHILRSIPDLIVVFDSSGKVGFVSQSVSRFINMAPHELEGTSFWDRLCEDSVRLLKAAFMDSLAARKPDSDTAPLGTGVWELRLMDKDSNYKVVTLNGVVHFSGEAPECVCCIRPRDQRHSLKLPGSKLKKAKSAANVSSSSDGSRSPPSESADDDELIIRAKPNQSVIAGQAKRKAGVDGTTAGNGAVRISDGDSGCEVSSSSDDGIASSG